MIANNHPPFLILPYEILQDDRLTLRQVRVLMALFSWRKKNTNLSRVSREMLSNRTNYPVNRVSTVTTELEQLGWISKMGNGGKSQWSEYKINDIDFACESNGYQNSKGYRNGNGYQNGKQTVTELVRAGVTDLGRGIDTERKYRKNTDIKEKEEKEKIRSYFKKPTTKQIQDYVTKVGLDDFDVNHFYDYYESKGWVIGKTKMKSWQHALRNWHRRGNEFKNGKPTAMNNERMYGSGIDNYADSYEEAMAKIKALK